MTGFVLFLKLDKIKIKKIILTVLKHFQLNLAQGMYGCRGFKWSSTPLYMGIWFLKIVNIYLQLLESTKLNLQEN